ncbi:penicillin-binding protein 1C [soil metagenome]
MTVKTKSRLAVLSISLAGLLLIFAVLDATFPFHPAVKYSTIIYDRKGRLLQAYLSDDDKWRMPCTVKEVNPLLLKTLLQKEDKFFYFHPGVNPVAIFRAGWNNLFQGRRTSGASTLTMQVVRLLEPRNRTILNKMMESFRAVQLECHYSKNQILALYLSLAPYGGNVEGVKAASYIYFGKPPALLSPAEAVTLTIIPNRPSSLRPGKNNAFLLAERNKWLSRLALEQTLPPSQLQDALAEPLQLKRKNLPAEAPHLCRRLHFSQDKKIIIQSTLDNSIQQKVQQLCYNHVQRLHQYNIRNAAIIVIDNETREVLAYAGSQDFNDRIGSGQVDGVNSIRSPGSALKPLVYGMAFDAGWITPKSVVYDVPVNFAGYSPENFNSKFNGKVTSEQALAFSLNIPAVDLLDKVTVPTFTSRLASCGFVGIQRQASQLGLSAILGGCGVTLEELAASYCTIANNGKYRPLVYTIDSRRRSTDKQMMSSAAAFFLTEILTKPNRPDLPNLFESSLHIPKVAWKTGTSYGRRDAWSIGFNKKYTVGVWAGNFDGTGVPELTGADMATPLLFQVFNSIDYNSTNKWFAAPAEVDLRYVCPETGMIPGDLCADKVMDYFIPGVSSMEPCHHLKEIAVSADEKFSYCINCMPEAGYKKKLYVNPPPELLRYYTDNQIPVSLAPEHNQKCERIFEGKAPRIISLNADQEYLIEKEEPKQLELKCAASADVQSVFWYINDRFIRKAKPGESAYFMPEEGMMKISCSDDKGRNKDIKIKVTFY